MRSLLIALLFSILALAPSLGNADTLHDQIAASNSDKSSRGNPQIETYRGYALDLSDVAERKDIADITDGLRHQLDIVENVGLSPSVLKFFRTIPIAVDETACQDAPMVSGAPARPLACYGHGMQSSVRSRLLSSGAVVWNHEKSQWINKDGVAVADAKLGLIEIRSSRLDVQRPVVLHEMLHAYQSNMISHGAQNPDILFYYKKAKDDHAYPDDAYALTNEREFFAVTASVFLFGKDGPLTRSNLKEKQPDYFKYLVWVFGFDPDRGQPVASVQ
jgi:hypothetical protein